MSNKKVKLSEGADEISPEKELDSDTSVAGGHVLDFIGGEKLLKETPKELVRQRIARALFHEYGISVEDMEGDFPVKVDGKRKRLDIAIFHHGQPHTDEQLSRAVVCRPEPKLGRNSIRIRDYDQAEKDLQDLKEIMESVDSCQYGLWTNGLEFFYLEKKEKRFEVSFEPIGDWPMGEESLGTKDVLSDATTRRAEPERLKIAFRRCHNFIHGNEGMPKDAAFWQFLYLIFCKMHDESAPRGKRQFWAGAKEQFDEAGRVQIRKRILPLFEEVKQKFKNIFRGNEEIILSDRALAFLVSELARYDFLRTDVDAKGVAYQELVGTNLRGDRGQYFTPRGVTKLAVEMLNPKENESTLDPACGTGGFLRATLGYMLSKFREEAHQTPETESTEEFFSVHERLRHFAQTRVFGADFDQFLVRATQMNLVMSGDGHGHLYHLNSLEFPDGYLSGLEAAKSDIPLGSIDVVITNPPFGSDIPITDLNIIKHFDLAHVWERTEDGTYRKTGKFQGSVAPEVLFIERCLNWLKPGGRMAIVLPDGILGNPKAEYIRWWILRQAWVLASVDLPVELFIVEANVNILTSVLFLKKKSREEILAEDLQGSKEYPVFMAVAEKVGVDRRGNTLYKRTPEGEEVLELQEKIERIHIGDRIVTRTVNRKEKIVENDLPLIAQDFRKFLSKERQIYTHLADL